MRDRYLLAVVFMAWLVVTLPLVHAAELSLTYDANGNLVSGDGFFRTYNSLNQLWRVYNGSSSSDPLLEEYTFHPTEERVLVKKLYWPNGTVREATYYVTKTFVRVLNGSGTHDFTYVYVDGMLVAQRSNGTTLFIHGNHEGSSSVVTNASGSVVETTTYTPFGEVLTGGTATRYGYEGKEHDLLVGDTDFHFRKYKAEWAIFLQPDDIIQEIYDPQMLNRYSFERNSPYKYIDRTGHYIESAIDGAFLIWDIKELWKDPTDPLNWAALGLDLITTTVPFVAGGSLLVRGGDKIHDLSRTSDTAQNANKAVRTADKAKEVSKLVDLRPNAYNKLFSGTFIQTKKLQHLYKHAPQFGVTGKWNLENAEGFLKALQNHVTGRNTRAITGTYRGTIKGTHYYDATNDLWVFANTEGNVEAAMKLSSTQVKNMLRSGNVQ